MRDDRREFQRLKLSKPLLATMRSANALILDVGLAGAFLEHYGTAEPGERFDLTFRWQGEDVSFSCEVVRSGIVRAPGEGQSAVSHTGVRFVEARGDAQARLQNLIASFVGHILDAQKANASGVLGEHSAGATILARLGEARRTRSKGFVAYHLKEETWWRVPTTVARQPPDGFTVGAYEDEEEIETLCRAYEAADEEGRNLIRLVAELSLLQER